MRKMPDYLLDDFVKFILGLWLGSTAVIIAVCELLHWWNARKKDVRDVDDIARDKFCPLCLIVLPDTTMKRCGMCNIDFVAIDHSASEAEMEPDDDSDFADWFIQATKDFAPIELNREDALELYNIELRNNTYFQRQEMFGLMSMRFMYRFGLLPKNKRGLPVKDGSEGDVA